MLYDGLDQYSKDFIYKLSQDMQIMTQINYPSIIKLFQFSFLDFDNEPHLTLFTEYVHETLLNPIQLNPTEKLIYPPLPS